MIKAVTLRFHPPKNAHYPISNRPPFGAQALIAWPLLFPLFALLMRIMEERIFIVEKRNDYLREFWKITSSEFTEEEFISLLKYFTEKRKVIPFHNYSDKAELILWNRNDYTELCMPGVKNVDGIPWPKRLSTITFFPMADIKTEEDLKIYNAWRMDRFKRHILYLQNYFKWVPLADRSEVEEWLGIDVEEEVKPLFPKPLEIKPPIVRFLRKKLDEGFIPVIKTDE